MLDNFVEFVGEGTNFQDALNTAVEKAKNANPVIDGITAWEVVKVEGRTGGLHGSPTTIRVSIKVVSQG